MLKAALFALFLVVGAAPAWAAPSFDCTKAVTAVEKTICADDHLAQLDVELAALYKAALEKGVVTPAAQREWVKGRDPKCNREPITKGIVTRGFCVEVETRKRIEDLRQRNLTGLIATDTLPQFPVFNVPDQWWGYTPVYPEGVKNPHFEELYLSEGKIVANLHWDKPDSRDFDSRWVDVITGEIVADSISSPELARLMATSRNAARIEPSDRPLRIRFEDGRRIDFEFTHTDRCNWPLNAGASLYEDQLNSMRSVKILRKLSADYAFYLPDGYGCDRFKGGPGRVMAHFETMNFEVLFGAADGTLVARLWSAAYFNNGNRLVRFRRDLSSPYFQTTPDLAVVIPSRIAAVERLGNDSPPESRFAGLDALFSEARAEASKP